jgi:hypothetical protein
MELNAYPVAGFGISSVSYADSYSYSLCLNLV